MAELKNTKTINDRTDSCEIDIYPVGAEYQGDIHNKLTRLGMHVRRNALIKKATLSIEVEYYPKDIDKVLSSSDTSTQTGDQDG